MPDNQMISFTNMEGYMQNSAYISKICFKETLDIEDESGTHIGEFSGKIRESFSNCNTKSFTISIHSSKSTESHKEIEMSLFSNCTTNFQSFDEKWSQYNIRRKMLWHITIYRNLLTEGMNYAYMRYLAIIRYKGVINNYSAISINGILYKTTYICSVEEKHKVRNMNIAVSIIKRILQRHDSPQSPSIKMTSLFTQAGYLLEHTWDDNSSRKLVIKHCMVVLENGQVYTDSALRLRKYWDEDIRLKSMFLMKVSELKLEYKSYLKNNSEVKDMILDYIKEILIFKPEDVLAFSIKYFEEIL
ncbi:ciliogenesis-associated TTC17-interacting protein-like [Daktulosphaira vitifoliae]|uniref:ciliogenesis-associated TTC17-interacting protein-like n=1 Tax=Daktulosphaira vitifoliae TaxID=58002 RepID=UPI0021AA0327|nr:ciliogenesis-associated TTC17-interacting protein-like [Daktulosphaira vitifoliae]